MGNKQHLCMVGFLHEVSDQEVLKFIVEST